MTILYGGFVDLAANKGDAVHATELTRNLRKLGNRVIVVAHASQPVKKHDFYDTGTYENGRTVLSRLSLFVLSVVRAARWLISLSGACDVLYMRDYIFCALAVGAKLLYSKRIVWEVNGIAWHERKQKPHPLNWVLLPVIHLLERLAQMSADRILPVSSGVRDILLAGGCPTTKVFLLENGVNADMFSADIGPSVIEEERRRLDITTGVPVICYVGAIRPWQGLEILVLAAQEMSQKGVDTRYLVVGGGDGLERLKRSADERGVLSRFTFTGSVAYEKIPSMVALADVCVAPFTADRAASPMKVFEYMASGKPVIASSIPGLEFVEVLDLGTLVAPDNATELAQAILFSLANPEVARTKALNARDYVIKNRTWLSVARRAEAICNKVGAGQRSAARADRFQTVGRIS